MKNTNSASVLYCNDNLGFEGETALLADIINEAAETLSVRLERRPREPMFGGDTAWFAPTVESGAALAEHVNRLATERGIASRHQETDADYADHVQILREQHGEG
jgi:hypothetical protein